MGINNGHTYNIGTIWNTSSSSDGVWRQNKFIQSTLIQELDQDFKRLEGIIIKLIDQQKLVQMEQKKLNGIFKAQVEIMARLSGNGLKDKFLRIMEKGGMEDD